jgi:prepilin-type processing-associated H-X9-DG protein
MFGEACGDEVGIAGGFRHTWMGSGLMATYWGTQALQANGKHGWQQYGSKHTGVVNVSFADGAVRTVRGTHVAGTASQAVWWAATGMTDGATVNLDDL